MALNIVELPYSYFPDFNRGRPLFNADIYVGNVDTDPEIPANQKQVTVRQEDGTEVQIAQPVKTSAGGVPTYNGSPVTVLVEGSYSIKVLDRFGAEEYYSPDVTKGIPLTADSGIISYKASGGNSAVENMIAGTPITAGEGDVCSTGATIWICKTNNPTSLDDFEAQGDVFMVDFLSGSNDDSAFSDVMNYALTRGAVDFSNADLTITQPFGSLTTLATIDVDIKGDNCSITYIPASHTQFVIAFSSNANNVCISKGITLDVNMNANTGLYIVNESPSMAYSNLSDVTLNLTVKNNYRRDQAFVTGDAILVRGGFRQVDFGGSTENSVLAAGAGIQGSQGVSGFSVTSYGVNGYPLSTIIRSTARVAEVYSEDQSYTFDQDGVRVLTPLFLSGDDNPPSNLTIESGAVIKGCAGRHVKTQTGHDNISGTYIVDRGNNGTINQVIDSQLGGGGVDGANVSVIGVSPGAIFSTGGISGESRLSSSNFFKNSTITSDTLIPTITKTFPRTGYAGGVSCEDIDVRGDIDSFCELFINGDVEAVNSFRNINIESVANELVRVIASGGDSPYVAKVHAENCTNRGAGNPNLVTDNISGVVATADLTEINNTGFSLPDGINPSDGSARGGIAPRQVKARIQDGAPSTGTPGAYIGESFTLAAGATLTISQRGRTNNPTGLYVFIAANTPLQRTAMFFADSTGTKPVTVTDVAGDFEFGANSNPNVNNKFNVWVSSNQIQIQNQTSTARSFTAHSLT